MRSLQMALAGFLLAHPTSVSATHCIESSHYATFTRVGNDRHWADNGFVRATNHSDGVHLLFELRDHSPSGDDTGVFLGGSFFDLVVPE